MPEPFQSTSLAPFPHPKANARSPPLLLPPCAGVNVRLTRCASIGRRRARFGRHVHAPPGSGATAGTPVRPAHARAPSHCLGPSFCALLSPACFFAPLAVVPTSHVCAGWSQAQSTEGFDRSPPAPPAAAVLSAAAASEGGCEWSGPPGWVCAADGGRRRTAPPDAPGDGACRRACNVRSCCRAATAADARAVRAPRVLAGTFALVRCRMVMLSVFISVMRHDRHMRDWREFSDRLRCVLSSEA